MKRKILAVLLAMTMVMGMSISVCASPSPNSKDTVEEANNDSDDDDDDNDAAPAPRAEVITQANTGNTTGQVLTGATLEEFSKTTTVSGPAGASVTVLPNDTAKAMVSEANKVVGTSVFVASMVDLHGGAGTYTLGCPNVWAGQDVTIMHKKADGSYEYIKPSSVANNSVTFTLTSTSPVAILINTAAAPKTGDMGALAAIMTVLGAGGIAVFGTKARD